MALSDDAEEEKRIDAEVKETEHSIEELQKRRETLLQAKRVLRARNPGLHGNRPAKPEKTVSGLEETLNLLEWKAFKKKEGEWSFLRDREGRITEGLESEKEFVEQVRRGKEVVVGKYRYRASEDKFLNRFFADTK